MASVTNLWGETRPPRRKRLAILQAERLRETQGRSGQPVLPASPVGVAVPAPAGRRSAPFANGAPKKRALEEEFVSLRRERNALHEAFFDAAQLQRRLCGSRQLRRSDFEISSEVFAARLVSGDFCSVLDGGVAITLALGDIVGKGLAAGLWFTHFVGLIRMFAGPGATPAAALAQINRHLCLLQPEPPMASLFLARLDTQGSELLYCNAGQPPALLLRADGRVEHLREGGPMLGALPGAEFASGRVELGPGDNLIVYSDGIVECRNGHGEFGAQRLLNVARSAATLTTSQMLFSVLGAVQDFAGSIPRDDDFALMVVRRLGSGTPRRPSAH